MPTAYIDFNRGNDATGDGSISKPFKTLQRANNWNAGANGGILLARDSVWVIDQTLAASNVLSLTSAFNGIQGSRAFITAYDPPGVGALTSKPTITARHLPVSSDWSWDSTLNCGQPRGWYLQYGRSTGFWDARVMVAGQLAQTMNQDTTNNTGLGWINGSQNGNHPGEFVNGMTLDTLRFNLDFSGTNVAGATGVRLYLSGAGLRTPGAGNDPSSVVGPGQIVISFGTAISLYDAGNYCEISNLRFEGGAGGFLIQGTDNTVRQGLEIHDLDFYDTTCPIRINAGLSVAASNRWQMDIHHITSKVLTGPSFTAFGAGIAGFYRDSVFEDGNRASSMGGGVYMQVTATTQGGRRDPFVVKNNIARRWKNGAGNNEFDGGCYYVDVNDDGTILCGNRAYDSFVAFQCGSGKRSEWYSNIAVNCEQFVMMNNPNTAGWRANDYRFSNNLFVAAPRGVFSHGDTATVHQYHAPIYQVGPVAELVALRFHNNVMVNHPSNTGEVPVLLGRDSDWTSGKISAEKNLFIGYGTRLINADFGAVDRTSSGTQLPDATVPGWRDAANADYRIGPKSGLIGAGFEDARPWQMLDASGQVFQSPPAVGPHEVAHARDWFWRS